MYEPELIRRFKEDTSTGAYVEDNPLGYRIRIILRGEHLFYRDAGRALIVEMSSGQTGVHIYTDTIDVWDDGTNVTEDEKLLIIERIVSYFKRFQNERANLVGG